jgi:L-asparaginase II
MPMTNPVLVEAVRGALVESIHRGAVCVADADGSHVLALGDIERPVYPRSAVKALQALVMAEAGAIERFGLTDEEIAVACASHSGEAGHVAAVESMLAKIGVDASVLRCGAHAPMHRQPAQAAARGESFSALHNNCSGKHAGFLCAACAMGVDRDGYTTPAHPVQRRVLALLEELGGASIPDGHRAIDGCSVPTWALPLANLALAFARFGSGKGLSPERATAAARLRAACAAKPWYTAGTGRFCTVVMTLLGTRAYVKTGAEGVQCGALPELGLGIAIKIDDGASRASEVTMATVIARLLTLSEPERAGLDRFLRPTLRNWNGTEVGQLRPAEALTVNAIAR